ncbi:hypothetical protein ABN063_16015 [Providencia vermicola]|uniref:hypothetical protein n=1 Tax=Providencia vermicola TaxID=333965 RepID=UPI001CED61BB|nr:hypothetical protein [Providencia vermicola]
MSVKNLLQLAERRLEKTRNEQVRLHSQINTLQNASQDMRERILILSEQVALYEKSQELSPIAFWERQRLKAAVLSNIAQFEYEIDTMSTQIGKYQLLANQMATQARVLQGKCEKFQKYLKQQSITKCLKSEQQQHTEIEELFIHVRNKFIKE